MMTATTYAANLRKWRSGEAMREHTAKVAEKSAIDRVADAIIREAVAKGRAAATSVTTRETQPASESLEVRVAKAAGDLMTANPTLSRADAEVEVYKRHPELYEEECARTDARIPGCGREPSDAEYETAFAKADPLTESTLSESSKLKVRIDDLIAAELRRLSAERANATGGKAAPASTREEALLRVLETSEGKRLRAAFLDALNRERRAAAA